MITVRIDGGRLPFPEAVSFDFIKWAVEGEQSRDTLTLFDANGDRIATFYKWDGVDAGEAP